MAAYSTGTIAKLLGVSRETVRQWVLEFGDHMSDGANPPPGQYRKFSEDDVRICAYIAKARDIGQDTEQIHADLRSGSRAEPSADVKTITARKSPEYSALKRQIEAIEQQLLDARQETAKRDAQIELLERQLAESRQEIKQLNREIGRLQAGSDSSE